MDVLSILFATGLIVLAGLGIYKFLKSKKEDIQVPAEPLPPFNPTPDGLHPKGDQKEPEFIYMYSGDIINRLGKTYKWDSLLKKYIEVV